MPSSRCESSDECPLYQPLDEALREVRFVRVLDHDDFGIHCEFATFTLLAPLEYKALSYCWTKAQASYLIYLNGKPFYVRPNLYALLEILVEEDPSWFYIDAISINQDDLNEKSSQIQLMRDIYGGAQQVVVWLGKDGPVEPMEDILSAIHELETQLQIDTGHSEKALTARLENIEPDGIWRYGVVLAAEVFLVREYWSRVWIVQEVLMARSLLFRKKQLSLNANQVTLLMAIAHGWIGKDLAKIHASLGHLLTMLDESRDENGLNTSRRAVFILTLRSHLRNADGDARQMHLLEAIVNFAHQECTVPYDKIFGVLALTRSYLQPDYNVGKVELYIRLLSEGTLEAMSPAVLTEVSTSEFVIDKLHDFQLRILQALGLEIDHPTISLITSKIHELAAPQNSALYRTYHDKHDQELLIRVACIERSRSRASDIRARDKFEELQVRLSMYSEESLLPRVDDESGPQSYNAWMKEVEKIYGDVFDKWTRSQIS